MYRYVYTRAVLILRLARCMQKVCTGVETREWKIKTENYKRTSRNHDLRRRPRHSQCVRAIKHERPTSNMVFRVLRASHIRQEHANPVFSFSSLLIFLFDPLYTLFSLFLSHTYPLFRSFILFFIIHETNDVNPRTGVISLHILRTVLFYRHYHTSPLLLHSITIFFPFLFSLVRVPLFRSVLVPGAKIPSSAKQHQLGQREREIEEIFRERFFFPLGISTSTEQREFLFDAVARRSR